MSNAIPLLAPPYPALLCGLHVLHHLAQRERRSARRWRATSGRCGRRHGRCSSRSRRRSRDSGGRRNDGCESLDGLGLHGHAERQHQLRAIDGERRGRHHCRGRLAKQKLRMSPSVSGWHAPPRWSRRSPAQLVAPVRRRRQVPARCAQSTASAKVSHAVVQVVAGVPGHT